MVSSNEQPVIIQTNYIRIDFFPDLDTYREQLVDLYYFIQKHYGIKFETGEEHINISSADFLDAQILNIEPGSPIFSTPEQHTVHWVLWNTWKPGSVLICAISWFV